MEEIIEKPLTPQQRMKRGRLMKRLAKRIARAKERKKKKLADKATLEKRALKKAREIARTKVAGKKGKSYKDLSYSEKVTVDKLVTKRFSSDRIKKIAKKIMPKVRKAEQERLLKYRKGQSSTNEEVIVETGGAGRWGMPELTNRYKKDTPGQVKEVKQDKDIKDKEGTQPAKYYAKDAEGDEMSKSTKSKRDAHFKKGAEMDDDNPNAYKPAPGDKGAKTKPSKHTKKFKDMFGEGKEENAAKERIKREKESDKRKHDAMLDRARTTDTRNKNIQTESSEKGLKAKAEKSGMPLGILKQVFNRGKAAWRTGHRPGTTPEQWGYARVNSFVTKSKGTWGGADSDLAAKVKGKK